MGDAGKLFTVFLKSPNSGEKMKISCESLHLWKYWIILFYLIIFFLFVPTIEFR